MPRPGRLSENDPEDGCNEREPLGVKQIEARLGVSDVELIKGGTVISSGELEEDGEDEAEED